MAKLSTAAQTRDSVATQAASGQLTEVSSIGLTTVVTFPQQTQSSSSQPTFRTRKIPSAGASALAALDEPIANITRTGRRPVFTPQIGNLFGVGQAGQIVYSPILIGLPRPTLSLFHKTDNVRHKSVSTRTTSISSSSVQDLDASPTTGVQGVSSSTSLQPKTTLAAISQLRQFQQSSTIDKYFGREPAASLRPPIFGTSDIIITLNAQPTPLSSRVIIDSNETNIIIIDQQNPGLIIDVPLTALDLAMPTSPHQVVTIAPLLLQSAWTSALAGAARNGTEKSKASATTLGTMQGIASSVIVPSTRQGFPITSPASSSDATQTSPSGATAFSATQSGMASYLQCGPRWPLSMLWLLGFYLTAK